MKIALVRLSALGDIVHSMIVLQFIKRHFPDCQIDWFCEEGFAPLLEANPHIERIVPVRLKKLKRSPSIAEFKELLSSLKSEYDIAIDLQGLVKSSLLARFLAKKRIGPQIGCAKEWPAALFYTDPVVVPCEANIIDRNLIPVSKALGFTYTKEEILHKEPYLFASRSYPDLDRYLDSPAILLVPSSSQPNKNYPAQKYIEVAKNLDANILVLWGNEEEKKTAQEIANDSPAKILPKLSLDELKYLISRIDLVIGGDTGPTHMAWAMNRASIVLFGYTTPNLMFQTPKNIAIWTKEVDLCRWDKKDDAITRIEPDAIIAQANYLLERV